MTSRRPVLMKRTKALGCRRYTIESELLNAKACSQEGAFAARFLLAGIYLGMSQS
jgi:hypothetical protein